MSAQGQAGFDGVDLDNWPNETGFTLVDLAVGQFYEQVLPGGFNFGDQLATYTYDFCVALGFELILLTLTETDSTALQAEVKTEVLLSPPVTKKLFGSWRILLT